MTRQAPEKRKAAKVPKVNDIKSPASLAQKVSRFKLPQSVYYLDYDEKNSKIHLLENLKYSENGNPSCTCISIVGSTKTLAFPEDEGDVPHFVNTYHVSASDCFSSLCEAEEELKFRELKRQKKIFLEKLDGYHHRKERDRIGWMNQYRSITLKIYNEHLAYDDESKITAEEELKLLHFRAIIKEELWGKAALEIVNSKFPTLVEEEPSDE